MSAPTMSPLFWALSLLSTVVVFGGAVASYAVAFRAEAGRRRCLPTLAFGLVLLAAASVGYFFGMIRGAESACADPRTGNLCGLIGVFVTGPLASDLAMAVIGSLIAIACRMRGSPAR